MRDTRFVLLEVDGYDEEVLYESHSLEDVLEFGADKSGIGIEPLRVDP